MLEYICSDEYAKNQRRMIQNNQNRMIQNGLNFVRDSFSSILVSIKKRREIEVNQKKDDVLDFIRERKDTTIDEITDKFNISIDSALLILKKLENEKKINIKA